MKLVLQNVMNHQVGEESEDSTLCALSRWPLVFLVHFQAQFHLSNGILGALLKFLKAFFRVLGRFSSLCAGIAQNVPSSLYKLSHTYGPLRNSFRRYVVCKKCHSVSIKTVLKDVVIILEVNAASTRLFLIIDSVE